VAVQPQPRQVAARLDGVDAVVCLVKDLDVPVAAGDEDLLAVEPPCGRGLGHDFPSPIPPDEAQVLGGHNARAPAAISARHEQVRRRCIDPLCIPIVDLVDGRLKVARVECLYRDLAEHGSLVALTVGIVGGVGAYGAGEKDDHGCHRHGQGCGVQTHRRLDLFGIRSGSNDEHHSARQSN
jgi:hypothetical protein